MSTVKWFSVENFHSLASGQILTVLGIYCVLMLILIFITTGMYTLVHKIFRAVTLQSPSDNLSCMPSEKQEC